VAESWVRVNLKALTPRRQQLSSLCWLTCYQMLYDWKSLDPATIPDKLKAAGIDYDQACRTGLMPADNAKAARALGLSPVGFGQQITAFDFKQRLPFSPIWIAGEWFPNGLHARLVTGCSDNFVEYLDPWYGGTYGMDLDHRDLLDNFVKGGGPNLRGTNALIGNMQMSFWKT
jgi:hypothetical protein